jgi:hypothetical protein
LVPVHLLVRRSSRIFNGGFEHQCVAVERSCVLRGIAEYNGYRKSLTDDFLLSFTYIPGTVMYLGYGSLFEQTAWNQTAYIASNSYLETYRGIFFKMSYLWRS